MNKAAAMQPPQENFPPWSHRRINLETAGTSGFEYFDFTLSRSWKTAASDREGYSSSFFVWNVEELQAVIQEATDWIESQQASLREATISKLRQFCRKRHSPEWAAIVCVAVSWCRQR